MMEKIVIGLYVSAAVCMVLGLIFCLVMLRFDL